MVIVQIIVQAERPAACITWDAACPISTEGWTRRVHLVRGGGGGGGGGRAGAPCSARHSARSRGWPGAQGATARAGRPRRGARSAPD